MDKIPDNDEGWWNLKVVEKGVLLPRAEYMVTDKKTHRTMSIKTEIQGNKWVT